jgi:hypothetical protein
MRYFLLSFVLFFVGNILFAQHTFVPLDADAERLIQRYEIRTGTSRNSLFTDIRPYNRANLAEMTRLFRNSSLQKSHIDDFNVDYLLSENIPWSEINPEDSKKAIFGNFYKSKANLYQVNEPGFNLFINPGLLLEAGKSDLNEKPLYTNTRAIEIRGDIGNKVGFYTFISENQMRIADHERQFVNSWKTYPGAHLIKSFKDGGIDFFQARGYITFSPLKEISFQFGQDRNFIGNGMRSLLLSGFATDYPFLKINTKIWRLNYMNLFAKLTDRYGSITGTNITRPHPVKYLAMHYLSIDLFENLNIGLFESVTFHDNNGNGRGFDFSYLNPIIFYRSVEHQLGDPDKMMVGLNMSYLPVKNLQLYGQFMLNEFRINDLLDNNGHNANKFGYQAGAKYIDVAGITNLDLQVEYNRVRPYSYAHYAVSGDYAVNSYSHFNQPLAHPLGANFSEFALRLDIQPLKKLRIGLVLIHANYGADSSGSNWGGNIFLDYRTNEQELGNFVGQGVKTTLLITEAWASYQLRHNLFVDIDFRYRDLKSDLPERNSKNLYFGLALRLNLARKSWNY